MSRKLLILTAVFALVASASCLIVADESQADHSHTVGEDIVVCIPTIGCKNVSAGSLAFNYDHDVLTFSYGGWMIDARISDVKDEEGVFAFTQPTNVASSAEVAFIVFNCSSPGTATVNAKLTYRGNTGDVVEVVEPVIIKVSCDHALVEHPYTPATTDHDGNTLYYSCSKCGKYFSDKYGVEEIAKDSWIIPKIDPSALNVTINFACDGEIIADPVIKTFAEAGSSYNMEYVIDGYNFTGDVTMSGSPSGLVMTYFYEKIETAETVRVYAGQEGSSASVAIIGDNGIVPSGKVQLKIAYAYYEPELGFWVSDYDYLEFAVTGGDFTVIVQDDLSEQENYKKYFNLTATFTSSDGEIKEKSSKVTFTPI